MDYIGEPISQLGHALQCAHWAKKQGADDEVILAALFHDIGHLIDASAPQMDGLGVINHEGLGRAFLEEHGCSERVGKLVEAHVQAKRYLCFKNPKYYARLSEASKGTLAWQGGPMSETEATTLSELRLQDHPSDPFLGRARQRSRPRSRTTRSLSFDSPQPPPAQQGAQ